MSVSVEKRILIQCNYCGAYHNIPMTATKAAILKEFREEKGWSFGKRALCPVCNGRYFKEKGSE